MVIDDFNVKMCGIGPYVSQGWGIILCSDGLRPITTNHWLNYYSIFPDLFLYNVLFYLMN